MHAKTAMFLAGGSGSGPLKVLAKNFLEFLIFSDHVFMPQRILK